MMNIRPQPITRLLLGLLLAATVAVRAQAVPDIRQFTSDKIKTLRLDSSVAYEDPGQLEAIGGDFSDFYRVQRGAKDLSIPFLHIHKVEDIAGAPGKKNTLLDSGVVPP